MTGATGRSRDGWGGGARVHPDKAHFEPEKTRAHVLRRSRRAHRRAVRPCVTVALLGALASGIAGCTKPVAPTPEPQVAERTPTRPAPKRRAPQRGVPWIRVALAEGAERVTLELESPALLRCCGGQTRAWSAGERLEVTREEDVVVLRARDGTDARSRRALRIEPTHPRGVIRFGEHTYHGVFEVMPGPHGLTVVNEVPLETYLRGVVPWEIGWQDPQRRSAVEAQAIAARTYAYKRLGQHADAGFDVYADVSDQMYQGTTREDSVANRAIRSTHGTVLMAGDQLVEAYYCSTCGGHTSRIEAVWPKPAETYLRGLRDRAPEGGSAFCATSRHFRWQEAWSGRELEDLLQETLPPELVPAPEAPLGGLLDLRIDTHDETGRAHELVVEMTSGTYRVAGDRIRWVLRPRDRSILRSTLFKLDVERDGAGAMVRVIARGGGNGHGVGMCQVGALEMSRRGYDASAILAHYYPGTELQRLYTP